MAKLDDHHDAGRAELDAQLATLPLSVEYPCSYLPDRLARQQQFFWPKQAGHMPGAFYQQMMDRHFRRSGRLFYRPRCIGCQACVPIRLDVRTFAASRSQERSAKKNTDVVVRWQKPVLDAERVALYGRYTQARHDRDELEDPASALEEFLYDSPTDTLEGSYWVGDRLIGCGICDLTPVALSTVYFYFDPAESKRSLGVYSALQEIAYARGAGLTHYYLGYYISDCRKMEYKAGLGDHELLEPVGWQKKTRRLNVTP
ncbi:MAG: arginyltransferase [Deltaproteobacteria bacterium]|nr:arginyltransferase [Deltaproteobacteria bacterium]